ncbi:hypothetical protein COCNU_04G014790 [Cocos nucifera]|uniref:DUF7953 domain-containing protein n=1 Tax=Cocos nucifera TaxID=13894 RepID=A0A8K0I713_COCNU|nr:hypothetical protein COCNU_04G014790 [Cocos nucifera]
MKRPRYLLIPRLLLIFYVFFYRIPGIMSTRFVTLGSIELYQTHDWFPSKPTVYFSCQGENRTILPDVKQKNILYTFKGEESWQPLTELPVNKCKRCGLYEEDTIKSDDVFDEWELCPDDFVDGKYSHFKDKEFNATFICLECTASADSTRTVSSDSKDEVKKPNVALLVIICVLASVVTVIGMVTAYKLWQKRKMQQDQARFLKLFEEGDDIEDELGIGRVI